MKFQSVEERTKKIWMCGGCRCEKRKEQTCPKLDDNPEDLRENNSDQFHQIDLVPVKLNI
jgi:hypothetical protein